MPDDRGLAPQTSPPSAAPAPPSGKGQRGALGNLDHGGLLQAQAETLAAPRRRYGPPAWALVRLLDTV